MSIFDSHSEKKAQSMIFLLSLFLFHSSSFYFDPYDYIFMIQDFLDQQDGDISIDGIDFRDWIKDLRIYQEKLVVVENYLYLNNFTLFNLNIVNISAEDTSSGDTKTLTVSLFVNDVNISSTDIHVPVIPDPTHVSIRVHDLFVKIPIVFNSNSTGYVSSVSIEPKTITVTKGSVDVDSDNYEFIIKELLKSFLPNIFQNLIGNNVPTILNNLFDQLNTFGDPYMSLLKIQAVQNWAEKYFDIDPTAIKDLRTASVIDMFRFLLNVFIAPGGKFDINWVFNKLTNDTGIFPLSNYQDTMNFTMPINFSLPIENVADFNFTIKEMTLSGLNTFKDFNFFSAKNGYTFDSSLGISNLSINIEFGMSVYVYDHPTISYGGNILTVDDNITITLNDNKLSFELQLVSPKDAGDDYTDGQCMNISCIEALFTPNETRINSIHTENDLELLKIFPVDYNESSQEYALENSIYIALQNSLKFFQNKYSSVFGFYTNALFNIYLLPVVDNLITELLESAYCPDFDYERAVAFNLPVTMIGLGAGIGVVLIIYLVLCFSEPFRNQVRYRKLQKLVSSGEFNLSSLTTFDGTKEFENAGCLTNLFRDDSKGSLMMDKKLPLWIRMLMPLLIFINIAIFVSSNSGLGIAILLKIYVSETRVIELPSLFNFYLLVSVHDIWVENAKLLATLITVFSIIWPYVKLLLMLFVWMAPTTFLNKKRREGILKVLDALGKWSFFDTFVMSIIIAGFGLVLEFPIQDPSCPESIRFRLMTVPDYAFFALAIGTVFSLTLSHVMLALHRYADDVLDQNSDNSKESMFNACPNVFYRHFITFSIFATFVLFAVGIFLNTFSLNFVGLVGYIMELLGIENIRYYSVFSIASKVIETAEDPNSFGIRFVQVLYIIIALIIPFLHVLALFILWVVPFSKRVQIYLYKTCEILYSWASLDVLAISLLGALTEVASFAKSLSLSNCGAINPTIAGYFYDVPYVTGHEYCFDAYTVFKEGAWILFVGSFLQNFITIAVNYYSKKALHKQVSSDSIAVSTTQSLLSEKKMLV